MKSGWTQVLDQAGADELLRLFNQFQDSILRECKYCSGTYVDSELYLHLGRQPFLRCLFQRQWTDPISVELVFGELRALRLTPDPDNPIELARLQVESERIIWSEGSENLVESRVMHWRVVDDWVGLRERYSAVSETDLNYYDSEPAEDESRHYRRSPGRSLS